MASPVGRTVLAVLRVWLGYEWISAAMEKITSPAWVGAQAGQGVAAYLKGSIANASGAHPAVQAWYAAFLRGFALPNAVAFSYVVTFGELLVGLALIFGFATSLALAAGMLMNMAYMLAGTTSTNPILFALAAFLLALGPDTSFEGLDHFVARYYRRWYVRLTEGVRPGDRGMAHQH